MGLISWRRKCGLIRTSASVVGSVFPPSPLPHLFHPLQTPVNSTVEGICFQVVLEKGVQSVVGVKSRLDELARTLEFQKIYHREIEAGELTLSDVERCLCNIYHELSKHAHGNDGVIPISLCGLQ